ncbi:MAG: hypothetical protein J6O23_08400 [Prevotella sp.]|nr:hypothetical protein [Prevotella sp.]
MAMISLNPTLYTQAQHFAKENNMSVDEWIAMLIKKFVPAKKKEYRMKGIEELSPELQAMIGFAKSSIESDEDINGDKARMEYLTEKYAL